MSPSQILLYTQLQSPLEQIYDPFDEPEGVMEIELVGKLPASYGYRHIPTARDVFSRYIFAVLRGQPSTSAVALELLDTFAQHAYVPNHMLTYKGSAFTFQVLTELMSKSGNMINHATLKHVQTIRIEVIKTSNKS